MKVDQGEKWEWDVMEQKGEEGKWKGNWVVDGGITWWEKKSGVWDVELEGDKRQNEG